MPQRTFFTNAGSQLIAVLGGPVVVEGLLVEGELLKTSPAPASSEDDETHFITVDLDIFSKRRLLPIVEAFGDKVAVLHEGRSGTRYSAHVELECWNTTASQELTGLIALIRGLPQPARRLWDTAQSREFNIGIQAAAKSRLFELRLPPATLEAVASVGGRLVITVYAPERLRARFPITNRRAAQQSVEADEGS